MPRLSTFIQRVFTGAVNLWPFSVNETWVLICMVVFFAGVLVGMLGLFLSCPDFKRS